MLDGLSGRTFSLVLPTLNEAGNIDMVLGRLTDVLSDMQQSYEIVVVDDGSSDGTAGKVQEWGNRDPRIRVICRSGERGLAGAVLCGWSQSRADLLGVMDADLQHPPDLLPQLLHGAERADIVIASRYAHRCGTKGWNPVRVVLSKIGTFAAERLISKRRLRVTDPMSGFFVVHRRCVEGIKFQTTGFKLLLEILVRARIGKVAEVPYQFGLRQAGSSKAGATVGFQYLRLLSRLSKDIALHSGEQ